jgi:hypothetical protein
MAFVHWESKIAGRVAVVDSPSCRAGGLLRLFPLSGRH